MKSLLALALLIVLSFGTVYGREADVVEAKVKHIGDRTYSFEVTVLHADEGWKHYVNKWDVVAPDGTVLATRTLYHPHVHEQPFTRSLSGVKIPEKIRSVIIQAHDSVHKYGGAIVAVDLPR